MTYKEYLDIFKVTETQLKDIIDVGRAGGDWCDLYFEDTVYNDLLLRDGQVASGGFSVDYGCGVRVLNGEKTGYAYSESTDYASLISAARAAASMKPYVAHKATSGKAALKGRDGKAAIDSYPFREDWRKAELSRFVPWLRRLDEDIHRRDARVSKVIAMLSFSMCDILMYNSLGEMAVDTRPMGSVAVTVIFTWNGRTEQKNVSRSWRKGAEMVNDVLLETLASEAVKGVDESFAARRPKGGRMKVVMGAGASGILLHEAMGHAFEADFNRKGQSIFCDRMGKRICPRGINILDDATIPGNRGAINVDDEGIAGQKTYMVQDGVLNSYLHDRISAAFYGVRPTGNGRRESFRYNPIPRMRATYMESGTDGSCEDLIASVRKGVYVDQFSNGEVKIGEGDFTFYVKSGFLIENGRLTMPVKDINIIGNGPKALADIEAVGSDLKIDDGTWTCGKEQSVAVSCGMPSVLIGNLTVGGE